MKKTLDYIFIYYVGKKREKKKVKIRFGFIKTFLAVFFFSWLYLKKGYKHNNYFTKWYKL